MAPRSGLRPRVTLERLLIQWRGARLNTRRLTAHSGGPGGTQGCCPGGDCSSCSLYNIYIATNWNLYIEKRFLSCSNMFAVQLKIMLSTPQPSSWNGVWIAYWASQILARRGRSTDIRISLCQCECSLTSQAANHDVMNHDVDSESWRLMRTWIMTSLTTLPFTLCECPLTFCCINLFAYTTEQPLRYLRRLRRSVSCHWDVHKDLCTYL